MNDLDEHMPGLQHPSKETVTVKVPASSANLGPGFDSFGLALDLYLTLVASKNEEWDILPLSSSLSNFPRNETNFIAQVAIQTAKIYQREMPSLHILVSSEIPLARGLGSSAAAIVAGIELANEFCELSLDKQEKLTIASSIEGHPDNVGACLYGGFVVGCQLEDEVMLTVLDQIEFDLVLVVPDDELLTVASREVLPTKLDFNIAVQASAISNQLLAALVAKQWKLAGRLMASDLFHQPYRKSLVPFYSLVEEEALAAGAYGVALSGAGPSLICLVEPRESEALAAALTSRLDGMNIYSLAIDKLGSRTTKDNR